MTRHKHASGNTEWGSPSAYVEAGRRCMGSIDTDPASNAGAQRIVQAKVWYGAEQNGLIQPWTGNVWLNPPYKVRPVRAFARTLLTKLKTGEIDRAIWFSNNATETLFFQALMKEAAAMCLPDERIRFLRPDGTPGRKPLQGQALLYFGEDVPAFRREFAGFGQVVYTDRLIQDIAKKICGLEIAA